MKRPPRRCAANRPPARHFRGPPPWVSLRLFRISTHGRKLLTRLREPESGAALDRGQPAGYLRAAPPSAPSRGPPMDAAVIVFPGSNREHDIMDALRRSSGK